MKAYFSVGDEIVADIEGHLVHGIAKRFIPPKYILIQEEGTGYTRTMDMTETKVERVRSKAEDLKGSNEMTVAWNANPAKPARMTCDACGQYVDCQWDNSNQAWLCIDHYHHANASDMVLSRRTFSSQHDNEAVVVNEQGGKQSALEYSYELIEPDWLRDIAHVLYRGKLKYGPKNWQSIPDYREHLGRALYHIQQALEDIDHTEMHFANAACRLMFADWCYKRSKQEHGIALDHVEKATERLQDLVKQARMVISHDE